ncbi:MAG: L-aspartate oxidase [Proteobacteria bacterium]|nr:L-aspartate oxidase [Pseudomonadota bacterium]
MSAVFDILVIGSGAAGLAAALHLANHGKVAVLSKGILSDGSTRWAQGGIAAVLAKTDTLESHIKDTLAAGAGLCSPKTVRAVVEHSRQAIENLIKAGVPFSKYTGPDSEYEFHLTQEGGHSRRRIIHAADTTGKALQETLESKAQSHQNITLFEDHMAIDLISGRHLENPVENGRCYGAYALDIKNGHVVRIAARATILATGGASRVYLYTSNPDGSTGDGIALGWRAGCRVANMEFNQFHPTCLYHPKAKNFLISEALRGEGAYLRLPDGTRFMPDFHKKAELAPRDIVARAIDHEIKRFGLECVYLDITHKGKDFILEHFPTIHERCLEFGFDMTKEPLPVVPAAHYTCGGVMTDLKGRTDVKNLYAIGEVAMTGLHGANRMASNSLLECLVFAEAAASDIVNNLSNLPAPPNVKPWDESRVTDADEEVVVSHNWEEVRRTMWDYVGIVRTDKRLERALRRVTMLGKEVQDYYGNFRVTKNLLELRNLVVVAELIVTSAMRRKESRGLHYSLDYPDLLDQAKDTILKPK